MPTRCTTDTTLRSASTLLAATFASVVIRDDEANRTIWVLIAILVAAGLALLVFTLWFWRSSRPEHPALGPLEVMGSRRFWRRDAVDKIQRLDSARPEGAEPERSVANALLPHGPRPDGSAIDLELAALGVPMSFDDLHEPAARDGDGLTADLDDDLDDDLDRALAKDPDPAPEPDEDEDEDDQPEPAPRQRGIDPLLRPSD